MLLYPDVQAKASDELDRVVGQDRLPDFSDEEQLPYIKAVCLEVLRWHPFAPVGVPHRSIADDEYRGMFIPKGSVVIANAWYVIMYTCTKVSSDDLRYMLRNEAVYGHDVDDFRPERFLTEGRKPPDATFGFGRRLATCLMEALIFRAFDNVTAQNLHGSILRRSVAFHRYCFHPACFQDRKAG